MRRIVLLVVSAALGTACTASREPSRHAFRQIGRALETHDAALFHAYVDVESVVAKGLDAVIQRQLAHDAELETAGTFASGLVQATRPMLGALVRAKIDAAIDDPQRGFRFAGGRILRVRRDGIRTLARVELRGSDGEPVELDVVLTPHDGHLRVTEVDVGALLDAHEAAKRAE